MIKIALVPVSVVAGVLHVALTDQGALPSTTALTTDELLMDSAKRLAGEIAPAYLDTPRSQVGAYGGGDSIAVAYVLPLPGGIGLPDGYAWVELSETDKVLTDGESFIIAHSLSLLTNSIGRDMTAFHLVKDVFTVSDLRSVFEALWRCTLDEPNFRRDLLRARDAVVDTGRTSPNGRGRPGALYVRGPAHRLTPPISRPGE